ncbi:MAG: RDD family protein [Janthinobacterium lividum]
MKKQVIYAEFISRLFSATVDSFLLSILLPPIVNVISTLIYRYSFREYLNIIQTDTNTNISASISVFYTQSFYDYLLSTDKMSIHITCSIIMTVITFMLIGTYFICFWSYVSATPGKLILGMKIVDSTTLNKPSLTQLFKRYFAYLTVPIGIWFILFTKKRQALHDKIASTAVVKS